MQASGSRPLTVALLGTPDVSAATLYGFFDLLSSVRRDWHLLHGDASATSPFVPRVVSSDGAPFTAGNGVRVAPDAGFADCPRPDIVCITDLMVPPGEPLDASYEPAVDWLRQAWDAGATLCSACSGALLLAKTGLLDGEEATSHWAYCEALARDYPRTRWRPERSVITTGPGQRLMMAGSGTAWHMLALALIARYASPEEAMQVARINLIGNSDVSAVAYSSLTRGRLAEDAVVARCQAWAASNYHCEAPVGQLVALSGLAERTFNKRFAEATGMRPLEYIHTLRLEEAKQLLESTGLPVEDIAREVGYHDGTFFNRLFKRKVTLSPAQYRRRFSAMRKQLG